MKPITLIIIFLCYLSNGISQGKLFGQLVNASTNEKIQYANVRIKNSTIGTSSNADGYFELQIEKHISVDTLIISHLEFETKPLNISSLDLLTANIISLTPAVTQLQEVTINSKEPYEYFQEAIHQTKQKQFYPKSEKLYYRELVKDNNNYSKYADAILMVNYPDDKKQMMVFVDESRVVSLPKESDDVLDLVSPVDVSNVLEFQYLNILNRFQGDKRSLYDYSILSSPDQANRITYVIKPRFKPQEKNKLQYYGWVVTEDDIVTQIKIETDTLCKWEKSILGMTAEIRSFKVDLSFILLNEKVVLSQGQVQLQMEMSHKKFNQVNEYSSEFLALECFENQMQDLDKGKKLKSKTIYKHGNNYSNEFWKNSNIPVQTASENELLTKLAVEYEKNKEKKVK